MGLFFIIAFTVAWLVSLPPALAQLGLIEPIIPWEVGILIGLAPAVAATVAVRQLRLKGFWRAMFRPPSPAWTGVIALMPFVLLGLVQVISTARGAPLPVSFGPDTLIFVLLWLVLAFGEEIGWRGFALPRLTERFGFWTGSLILGLIWCVWHYPRLLGSPYVGSLSEAAPLIALFSLQIIISNFIICWLYYRSGRSVLASTFFHASFNVVATIYFLAATDLLFTGLLAAIVLGIAILDRPSKYWATPEFRAAEGEAETRELRR